MDKNSVILGGLYVFSGFILALGWSLMKAGQTSGNQSFFVCGVVVIAIGAGIMLHTLIKDEKSYQQKL